MINDKTKKRSVDDGYNQIFGWGYKGKAIEIAKQLFYDETVIKLIENAKNDSQIEKILRDARLGKM